MENIEFFIKYKELTVFYEQKVNITFILIRHFDREKQSVYTFEVRATDGGRYDARSEKAQVQITITDVNDNKPVFTQYPFTVELPVYSQPGQELLKVTATDKDEGVNAEIVYR